MKVRRLAVAACVAATGLIGACAAPPTSPPPSPDPYPELIGQCFDSDQLGIRDLKYVGYGETVSAYPELGEYVAWWFQSSDGTCTTTPGPGADPPFLLPATRATTRTEAQAFCDTFSPRRAESASVRYPTAPADLFVCFPL